MDFVKEFKDSPLFKNEKSYKQRKRPLKKRMKSKSKRRRYYLTLIKK